MSRKGTILFWLTIIYIVLDIAVLIFSSVLGLQQLYVEATYGLSVIAGFSLLCVLMGKTLLRLFYISVTSAFAYVGVYDLITGYIGFGIVSVVIAVILIALLPKVVFKKV